MSNTLAIATVTACLVHLLREAVETGVPGALVTWARPSEQGAGTPATGMNIFLYQTTVNVAFRNSDLPTRDAQGRLMQRPRAALDLHYLLSFYGDERDFEPQRLLGSVTRVLHEQPLLTPDLINETLNSRPLLAESNLALEIERVKVAPANLPLEELSRLWSMFFQVPYALSVAYQASLVFIEGEAPPRRALPVRRYFIQALPFQQPEIESIVSSAGADLPLIAGSTIQIEGRNLRGSDTLLRVAGVLVSPDPDQVTARRIQLVLAEPPFPAGTLRAGVQGVQVVQRLLLGQPPVPHSGFESNVAAMIVHPSITALQVTNPTDNPDGTRSVDIELTLNPPVGRQQRVLLLLNQRGSANPRAYSFEGAPRAADSANITLRAASVFPATYLLRVQVDGAESLLEVQGHPSDPVFLGPEVVI